MIGNPFDATAMFLSQNWLVGRHDDTE